jgi:hypothetical protein
MQDRLKKLAIILKSGPYENLTLSSIRFRFFGESRKIPIIRCQSWQQGFAQAQSRRFTAGLFVDSGTCFHDLDHFLEELANYPHKGIVGHLVDPRNTSEAYWLHTQCFYLDLDLVTTADFEIQDFVGPVPERSDKNVHHNHSPYWIRPSDQLRSYTGKRFGEQLLARVLEQGRPALNWIPKFRGYKTYLYNEQAVETFMQSQQSYIDLAEKQFWIFNNEDLNLFAQGSRLITPASGLFWILNIGRIDAIDVVDISRRQLEFAQELWNSWDGVNYGQAVADFVKKHNIEHLQLDTQSMDKLERIKLKKSSYLVEKTNTIFANQCIMYGVEDFTKLWQQRDTTAVSFACQSMLDYVKQTPYRDFDIWASNILDYKYSLLKHSAEEFDEFRSILKEKNARLR